jgi:hypothetical protein
VGKTRVIIEISPTRLELVVLKGDAVGASRAARLSVPGYADNWPGVLSGLGTQLSALVGELGASGAEATVLYHSPTAATGVFACAEAAGAAGAQRASRLALSETASFKLESNPSALERLWTDKSTDPANPAQAHTLGIADTEATTKAIADWVTQSGLTLTALIPVEVPGTVAAVDAALRLATPESVALVLYAGEHGSTLAAASPGRIRFIRQIAIGSESLVAVLAREHKSTAEAGTATLDAQAAAELLTSAGLPERGRAFDAARGIMAEAVLPLIQPILQRCVVDIKQSLRFGLEEKERETATLHGMGPGGRIGRLIPLIAEQAGLRATKPAEPHACDGNIHTWMTAGRRLTINLLPRGLRAEMTSRRIRRALWAGVGVALAVVTADTFVTRASLTQEKKAGESLKQRLDAAKPATSIQERLVATQSGLESARQRLAGKLDSTGAFDGAMAMISGCTPASIRLTQIHFTFDNNKPVCRLTGHAPLAAGEDSNAALRGYMDALTAVPIVRACRLGATQRGEGDHGPVQNFEMTLVLVELPAQPRPPASSLTEAAEDRP